MRTCLSRFSTVFSVAARCSNGCGRSSAWSFCPCGISVGDSSSELASRSSVVATAPEVVVLMPAWCCATCFALVAVPTPRPPTCPRASISRTRSASVSFDNRSSSTRSASSLAAFSAAFFAALLRTRSVFHNPMRMAPTADSKYSSGGGFAGRLKALASSFSLGHRSIAATTAATFSPISAWCTLSCAVSTSRRSTVFAQNVVLCTTLLVFLSSTPIPKASPSRRNNMM